MSGLEISELLRVRKVDHKQRKMQHTQTHTQRKGYENRKEMFLPMTMLVCIAGFVEVQSMQQHLYQHA